MFPEGLSLTELVSYEEWQAIQDSFSEALEITIRTVGLDGKLLSKTSYPTRICSEILPKLTRRATFCGSCLLNTEVEHSIDIKEETNFKCPLGLDIFVIPIRAVGKRIIAYIILGPFIFNRRKDVSGYEQIAQKLGIAAEQLMDVLIEINVFSHNKIYSINKLVKETFSHIAQAGYHKKRLGEMAPEIREMDPLFSRYYEEKILNSLLNACSLALDADSGSVMTMDKKTHILHIKVASKLDQDVVNNTNIKVGEGIAGVAAATAKPIILPEDGDKQGLSPKMKRKYIKSSMIIPFRRPFNRENSNDIYGVMNLNIVRKDKNFSEKDIAFAQELMNLASIALIPFQKPPANHS